MIDDMGEERVIPALSAYTRLECVSPAYDPDWAERGAIVEAAKLLEAWAKDQSSDLLTEIVQLPGRTPVLLIENGGSGDPIVIYGHMDNSRPSASGAADCRRSNRFERATAFMAGAPRTTATPSSPPSPPSWPPTAETAGW